MAHGTSAAAAPPQSRADTTAACVTAQDDQSNICHAGGASAGVLAAARVVGVRRVPADMGSAARAGAGGRPPSYLNTVSR